MRALARPRVAVILNVSSGTIERQGVTRVRHILESLFEKHGVSAIFEFLSGSELRAAATRARQQVIDRELDAVVVGGGDGSIRTVASALAESGVPLGVIPLGTLNHFATDLRIPLATDRAVAVIAAGKARYVDVGEVKGSVFVNNSSIGIYPYLVLERERRRRRKGLSKWAAMFLAAFRVVRHLPLRRLVIRVEGRIEPCRSPCVFVGNNEYRLTVPAFGRRDRLDRGELCVYVAKAQSRLSLFWLACRCILGLVHQERDLQVFKVRTAEIGTRGRRVLVAFDGEVESVPSPLCYRTRPGALRVLVPTATTA